MSYELWWMTKTIDDTRYTINETVLGFKR